MPRLAWTSNSRMRPVTAPSNVRIRFSASPRQNNVTSLGEMQWEAGRAYYGRWEVFWSE